MDAVMDREKAFDQLCDIKEKVSSLPLFPALGWVWMFDVLDDVYKNHQPDKEEDEVIAGDISLRAIFYRLLQDVDTLGLSMDSGGTIIEEVITDWMRDKDILIPRA